MSLRHIGDAGEDIGEPGLRVDIVELGRRDQRQHEGGPIRATIRTGKEP